MNRSKAGADQRAKSHSADFCSSIWPKAPAGALSDWLAAELRRAISDRRLAIGSRLPASRLLAAELQVSRGVVTEAYQRLSENGQVIGRRRAGTIIAAVPAPIPESRPGPMTAPKAADLFAAPAGSGTFDLLRSARATIDLFPGLPDLTAFHEAPGFAPNAPYWPSSLPPTWHTAIRAGHSPSG